MGLHITRDKKIVYIIKLSVKHLLFNKTNFVTISFTIDNYLRGHYLVVLPKSCGVENFHNVP